MKLKYSDRQIHAESGAIVATIWWTGNKGTLKKNEARKLAVLMAYAPEMYKMLEGTNLADMIKVQMDRVDSIYIGDDQTDAGSIVGDTKK